MLEATKLVAHMEGVLLDPVYTGKAMAGLLSFIREGRFRPEDNVAFLHSGGLPAIFAYRDAFLQG
jgi:1-aminocyclopropane-1-carboxylate deaminase/D-cysteine desulfhydrase-like pyridoxal-dependent ACC family enzyme